MRIDGGYRHSRQSEMVGILCEAPSLKYCAGTGCFSQAVERSYSENDRTAGEVNMNKKLLSLLSVVVLSVATGSLVQAAPILGGLGSSPTGSMTQVNFTASGDYSGVLTQDGVSFAEHFVGQAMSVSPGPAIVGYSGGPGHDIINGLPNAPLTLATAGTGFDPNNINVVQSANMVRGFGPDNNDQYGVGAVSMLFSSSVFGVGFDLIGGAYNASGGNMDIGTLFVSFFEMDGTLLNALTLNAQNGSYFFGLDGGYTGSGIGGISVWNLDQGGIGLANISYESASVPEPGTFLLMALGLLALVKVNASKRDALPA